MALLETKNLHTYFKTRRGIVKAVNGVSYAIEPGKTLGVVGESGSGKSVSAMSILRLLDGKLMGILLHHNLRVGIFTSASIFTAASAACFLLM